MPRIIRIVLFLFIPFCAHAQQVLSPYDSVLLSHPGFNGVVLLANRGNPVFYKAKGFRDFNHRIPLEKTDIFELASLSKQFTAMIIMILKEKGLLDFDDLAEKYIQVPYKGITIRQLLTHTSGLPDYQAIMDQHWDKTKVAGNTEILEYLNRYAPPKLFEPGEQYRYSNTGYVLLASIAEKVTGVNFVELCRRWIFDPLHMKSTAIRTAAEKSVLPNLAIGHIYDSTQARYIPADSFPSSNYTIWLGGRKGPGRVSSTAEDLLKWDQALYSNKLVSRATLNQAFQPMKLNNGKLSYYGFGWELRNSPDFGRIVRHTGDNPGFHTLIVRYLDLHRTAILLSNNAYGEMEDLLGELVADWQKPGTRIQSKK